jgi:hypothetical protein
MRDYLKSSGMFVPTDLWGTFSITYSVSGSLSYTEPSGTRTTKSLASSGALTYHFDGERPDRPGRQSGRVTALTSADSRDHVFHPPHGAWDTEYENWQDLSSSGSRLADALGRSAAGSGEIDFGREKPFVVLHPDIGRFQVAWFGSTVSVLVNGTIKTRYFPAEESSQPLTAPEPWLGNVWHCVSLDGAASSSLFARRAAAAEAASDMDNETLSMNFYAEGSYDPKTRIINGSASRPVAVVKGVMMTAPEVTYKLAKGEISEDDLEKDAFWGTILLGWHFFPKPITVEIKPLDESEYQKWLPEYYTDDACSEVGFKCEIKDKGKKGRFVFRLENVSQEPGICLNDPPEGKTSPPYDLVFAGKEYQPEEDIIISDNGQILTTTKEKGSAVVLVHARDFGAYGKLRCDVALTSGETPVEARDPRTGLSDISIPWDDNHNFIADRWELDYHCYGKKADDDDDHLPLGDGHKGDGFSVYEEYRGIYSNEGYHRMFPVLKELCVRPQPNCGFGAGVSLWGNLSGLGIYTDMNADEFSAGRVVNFHHKTAHVIDQHGLLVNFGELSFKGGYALGGPGTPANINEIIIEKSTYPADTLVAHELAHGCSVWHHGEADIWEFDSPEDGRKIHLAKPQGQHSGAEDCIMRYHNAFRYQGSDGRRWLYAPYEPEGKSLCSSAEGTGVNAGPPRKRADGAPLPKCGDARKGRGGCVHQICVNDKYADDPKHRR